MLLLMLLLKLLLLLMLKLIMIMMTMMVMVKVIMMIVTTTTTKYYYSDDCLQCTTVPPLRPKFLTEHVPVLARTTGRTAQCVTTAVIPASYCRGRQVSSVKGRLPGR